MSKKVHPLKHTVKRYRFGCLAQPRYTSRQAVGSACLAWRRGPVRAQQSHTSLVSVPCPCLWRYWLSSFLGGLGFSAHGHSQVVQKISCRSGSAAVSVMVPNSLGPGELLLR